MNSFKNKFLATAIFLCMIISIVAMPTLAAEKTAYATDATQVATSLQESFDNIYDENGDIIDIPENVIKPDDDESREIYIRSDELTINEPSETGTYFLDFYCEGSLASGFYLDLELPYFTNIKNITLSNKLDHAENAVFDTNYYENCATLAYSSAQNFDDTILFTVEFSLNYSATYESAYPYAYNIQFVNADAQEVWVNWDFGEIIVDMSESLDVLMGDANEDGDVTLEDVMYILSCIVKGEEMEFYSRAAADIDKNGTIDMIDCQYIQNYLVGNLDSLENVNGGNNDDIGEIIPPVDYCKHEDMYEDYRVDASCGKEGFVVYRCPNCNYEHTETLAPTNNHEYKDGACILCGYPEGENNDETTEEENPTPSYPTDAAYIYEDEEFYIEFFQDGTFSGFAIMSDINADGKLDKEDRNEIFGKYTVDETKGVVILHDELYGLSFRFKLDENGDIYR